MDRGVTSAAIRLFLAREPLVAEWERRVLTDDAIPSAHRLERFRLRDYVPRFIDIATEALRGEGYRGPLRARAVEFARVHVVERIDEAFALDEVLGELAHLRAVVLEHLATLPEAHPDICAGLEDARAVAEQAYAESGTRIVGAPAAADGKRGAGRLGA